MYGGRWFIGAVVLVACAARQDGKVLMMRREGVGGGGANPAATPHNCPDPRPEVGVVGGKYFPRRVNTYRADRGLVLVGKFLVDVLVHQARLTDAGVAKNDDLEQDFLSVRHGGLRGKKIVGFVCSPFSYECGC